jgi:hypothetical protein
MGAPSDNNAGATAVVGLVNVGETVHAIRIWGRGRWTEDGCEGGKRGLRLDLPIGRAFTEFSA